MTVDGDVGQFVNGDSHQGPRASASANNVLTVNFASENVRFISHWQRVQIGRLAGRVAAGYGVSALDVYVKYIFPFYRIEKITHLPASEYWHVVAALNDLLRADAAERKQERQNYAPAQTQTPAPARPRRRGWLRYVLALMAVLSIAWWLSVPKYISDALSSDLPGVSLPALFSASPEIAPGACMYDGKAHSPGSVVIMAGVRSVCSVASAGGDPVWAPVQQKPAKRRAQPKPQKPVQEDGEFSG